MPGVGTIIAAALLLIAAVIILIGQIMAKALEDQAAAKEKDLAAAKKDLAAKEENEEQTTKIKKAQRRVTDEMARRDDCTLFGKKPD